MSRPAKLITICALAASVAAIAVPAWAASTTTSTISIEAAHSLGGGDFLIYGQVSSHKEACVANRTVRIYAVQPDDSLKLLDSDRTGKSGRYAGIGSLNGATAIRASLIRKKIGHGKHRRVCTADTQTVT